MSSTKQLLIMTMTDLQIESLSELLAISLADFKKDHPTMNLQKDHYKDVIKCLEYALTGV